MLTLYPDSGLGNVTDADLVSLGVQLAGYEAAGRSIVLRWAPEMQGVWNTVGSWNHQSAIITWISATVWHATDCVHSVVEANVCRDKGDGTDYTDRLVT